MKEKNCLQQIKLFQLINFRYDEKKKDGSMIDSSLGNFHISSTSLIDSDWVENYVEDADKLTFKSPKPQFLFRLAFKHAVN